uniref:Monocarboxylate transporter n=1 Tax=Echinococcus granulosus TaxID=6210 RepID=A0A068WEE1_ECHGR|nr:monocarboxylate transporter [Echinococcus granulosus]
MDPEVCPFFLKPPTFQVQIPTILNAPGQVAGANIGRSLRAWLVLLSAFACTAVVDGLILSFGLHVLEMMEAATFNTWDTDGTDISFLLYLLPGALLTGMHLYASPLANVLSNRFDYRPVAMVSALLFGLILVGSAFLKNLEAFSLFFGICGGLSCGLLYFPSLSIVAQWFESRRALAVGLAICGSGVGTCLMALCVPSGVRAFSWRGLLIIFGAVFFQLSLAIALFRPVEVQQVIDLEKSRRRAVERRRRLERERIAAAIRHERLRQVAGRAQNQQRNVTSRVGGGIMSRILEEKFRQRSTSTGSLDGMVITRDNELISLRTEADYQLVKAVAMAAVTAGQTDETVARAPRYGISGQQSQPSSPPQARCFSALDRSLGQSSTTVGEMSCSLPQTPRPVILLSPPCDFSKSGVLRIADAILQKLEAQAVIAPGMRCPDMTNVFRRWPLGLQGTIDADVVRGGRTTLHPCGRSRALSSTTKVTTTTTTVGTGNSLYHSTLDNSNIPTLCISDDSGKAGSMDALDVEVGCRGRADEDCFRLSPFSLSISRSSSGGAGGNGGVGGAGSSGTSIDPKTDRAITSELSRVHLDSTVKARIRAAIYRELRRIGHLTSTPQDHQGHLSKTETGDLAQQGPYGSLESGCMEPTVGHNLSTPPSSFRGVHSPGTVDAAEDREVLLTCLSDTLDLPLLRSPSFLLFSLACTLHMFALFVPYHMLPLFVSLEGRTLVCGQSIRCVHSGSVFRVPEQLATVKSVICTVGIAHLLGRLIATFYIEHIVSGSSHLQRCDDNDEDNEEDSGLLRLLRRYLHSLLHRLADPMVLNIVSLVVGGASLLCIPLTTWGAGSPHHPLSSSCVLFCGILLMLVFLHTLASALALSLRSAVAVELIGVHHLTPAFVYLLVFQGAGAIAGPLTVGLIAEVASGIQIGARLLHEPQILLTGSENNPLSWAYYTCGLVFLLSALAYAPLRSLSAWETHRYLAKRAHSARPSALFSHSTSGVSAIGTNKFANQRLNDSAPGDGVPAAAVGDTRASSDAVKRKYSVHSAEEESVLTHSNSTTIRLKCRHAHASQSLATSPS